MKKNFWLRSLALSLAVCGIVLMVGAQQDQSTKTQQAYVDTPRTKIKNIDEALRDLERARTELERTLNNNEWQKGLNESMKQLDSDKMKLQIEQALSQVDAARIQAELQKAMKAIDAEKMKSDIQKALAGVDAEKMKTEMTQAMKELDAVKLKADIESSISKMDMQKLQAELHRLRETDMKKIEEQLRNIRPEIEKSMSTTRESIEGAKKELQSYKTFITELEKDGLVNQNDYTIEYRKGELFINGNKQDDSIKKKYSSFLKDRKDFTIKKDADHFNIKTD